MLVQVCKQKRNKNLCDGSNVGVCKNKSNNNLCYKCNVSICKQKSNKNLCDECNVGVCKMMQSISNKSLNVMLLYALEERKVTKFCVKYLMLVPDKNDIKTGNI